MDTMKSDVQELLEFNAGADIGLMANIADMKRPMQVIMMPKSDTSVPLATDIEYRDQNENSILHILAFHNYAQEMQTAIALGADVSVSNNNQESALHWAARMGSFQSAQCLTENGADVNVKDSTGATPLHYALEYGNPEIIPLLISAGSNPCVCDDDKYMPLHTGNMALMECNLQIQIDKKELEKAEQDLVLQPTVDTPSKKSCTKTGPIQKKPPAPTTIIKVLSQSIKDLTARRNQLLAGKVLLERLMTPHDMSQYRNIPLKPLTKPSISSFTKHLHSKRPSYRVIIPKGVEVKHDAEKVSKDAPDRPEISQCAARKPPFKIAQTVDRKLQEEYNTTRTQKIIEAMNKYKKMRALAEERKQKRMAAGLEPEIEEGVGGMIAEKTNNENEECRGRSSSPAPFVVVSMTTTRASRSNSQEGIPQVRSRSGSRARSPSANANVGSSTNGTANIVKPEPLSQRQSNSGPTANEKNSHAVGGFGAEISHVNDSKSVLSISLPNQSIPRAATGKTPRYNHSFEVANTPSGPIHMTHEYGFDGDVHANTVEVSADMQVAGNAGLQKTTNLYECNDECLVQAVAHTDSDNDCDGDDGDDGESSSYSLPDGYVPRGFTSDTWMTAQVVAIERERCLQLSKAFIHQSLHYHLSAATERNMDQSGSYMDASKFETSQDANFVEDYGDRDRHTQATPEILLNNQQAQVMVSSTIADSGTPIVRTEKFATYEAQSAEKHEPHIHTYDVKCDHVPTVDPAQGNLESSQGAATVEDMVVKMNVSMTEELTAPVEDSKRHSRPERTSLKHTLASHSPSRRLSYGVRTSPSPRSVSADTLPAAVKKPLFSTGSPKVSSTDRHNAMKPMPRRSSRYISEKHIDDMFASTLMSGGKRATQSQSELETQEKVQNFRRSFSENIENRIATCAKMEVESANRGMISPVHSKGRMELLPSGLKGSGDTLSPQKCNTTMKVDIEASSKSATPRSGNRKDRSFEATSPKTYSVMKKSGTFGSASGLYPTTSHNVIIPVVRKKAAGLNKGSQKILESKKSAGELMNRDSNPRTSITVGITAEDVPLAFSREESRRIIEMNSEIVSHRKQEEEENLLKLKIVDLVHTVDPFHIPQTMPNIAEMQDGNSAFILNDENVEDYPQLWTKGRPYAELIGACMELGDAYSSSPTMTFGTHPALEMQNHVRAPSSSMASPGKSSDNDIGKVNTSHKQLNKETTMLVPFLPARGCMEAGDVIVCVEQCFDCASHSYCAHHDEGLYNRYGDATLNAILDALYHSQLGVRVFAYKVKPGVKPRMRPRLGALEASIFVHVGKNSPIYPDESLFKDAKISDQMMADTKTLDQKMENTFNDNFNNVDTTSSRWVGFTIHSKLKSGSWPSLKKVRRRSLFYAALSIYGYTEAFKYVQRLERGDIPCTVPMTVPKKDEDGIGCDDKYDKAYRNDHGRDHDKCHVKNGSSHTPPTREDGIAMSVKHTKNGEKNGENWKNGRNAEKDMQDGMETPLCATYFQTRKHQFFNPDLCQYKYVSVDLLPASMPLLTHPKSMSAQKSTKEMNTNTKEDVSKPNKISQNGGRGASTMYDRVLLSPEESLAAQLKAVTKHYIFDHRK